MVCLVDGEPKTLGFTEISNEFIKHRREVITKRTLYDLGKSKSKAHLLEGLGIALLNVDEVIKLMAHSFVRVDTIWEDSLIYISLYSQH